MIHIPRRLRLFTRFFGARQALTAALLIALHALALNVTQANAQTFTRVAINLSQACALDDAGTARCWGFGRRVDIGSLGPRATPSEIASSLKFTSIDVGFSVSCAIATDSTLHCWGDNGLLQLGNPSTSASSSVPVLVSVPAGVSPVQVSVGDVASCIRTQAGRVWCWGSGSAGILGNGSTTSSAQLVEAALSPSDNAVEVSVGASHACARLVGGGAKCWGSGLFGQLGNQANGDSSVPVAVSIFGDPVTSISAGDRHTCAVLASGGVACWGRGVEGQLGNGSNANSNVLVSVAGLSANALSVSAGDSFSCAVLVTGRVECWGRGAEGQLGTGALTGSNMPVQVLGVAHAVTVSAGSQKACVLLASGAIQCWGENSAGELGNGTTIASAVPRFITQRCNMDLDANGTQSALTDGLIYQRALLGLSGAAVTAGVLGPNAKRSAWEELRGYLAEVCGVQGLAP